MSERNPFDQHVPEPAPARADDPVTARLRSGAHDAARTARPLPGARITALGARRRRRRLAAAGGAALCVAVTGIGLLTYGAGSRQPSVPPPVPPASGPSPSPSPYGTSASPSEASPSPSGASPLPSGASALPGRAASPSVPPPRSARSDRSDLRHDG